MKKKEKQRILKRVQRRIWKPLKVITSEEYKDEPNLVLTKVGSNWFNFPKSIFTEYNIPEEKIFSNVFILCVSRVIKRKNLRCKLHFIGYVQYIPIKLKTRLTLEKLIKESEQH